MRLKLLIAYDGTRFLGWQSQAGGNTVQDHLEAAFAGICGERIVVHGSGRTDAGVHAAGQCAHVDVSRTLGDWPRALNAHLPPEIRVLKCSRARGGFHARFSAIEKTYRYRIWNAAVLSPFELNRAWHFPSRIDVAALKAAARKLTGRHDFASFAASRGKPEVDTVRTVSRIAVKQKGPVLTLTFTGNGFLYKMVRLLTGSMVRVAQGRAEPEWLDRLLARETKTSFAAPAEGLYLQKIRYGRAPKIDQPPRVTPS